MLRRRRDMVAAMGGGGIQYGPEQNATLQPDGTAGFDTFIDKVNANTNNGTSTNFYIGDPNAGATGAVRGLIKFDLSSIPSNALIVSATLSLYEAAAADTSSVGTWAVTLHRLLRDWVEAQATWNIYSTGNSWGTAGAGAASDRVAAASASLTLDGTAALGFVSWTGDTLKDDVQKFLDGTYDNYGWMVQAPAAEEGANVSYNLFRPSDWTTASQRPKLELVYQVPL